MSSETTIAISSKITVGVAVLILGGVIGVWSQLWNMQRDLEEFRRDRYTMSQARLHAIFLATYNGGIHVPDPSDPEKLIKVTFEQADR